MKEFIKKIKSFYKHCKKWNYKNDNLENKSTLINWIAFDYNKIETRPKKYDRYLICKKDGKIHWEIWNGAGWAYNHNEITFWAIITHPKKL